jgi:hypothetical protein
MLAIPAAAGLAVALVVACETGPTQASDLTPDFATRVTNVDNTDGVCPNRSYDLVDTNVDTVQFDTNNDGRICQKISGGSGGKHK